jgi:hypothetical protein
MERTAVASTSIAAIGYDEPSGTLEIEFLNGSIYQYFDVPIQIYEELVSASSAGSYLASKIKGNYRFSRV